MASCGEITGEIAPGVPRPFLSGTYSLTILIKLLELSDRKASDGEEHFKLLLNCGETSVSAAGTLASLNKEGLGNVIGLLTNADQFVRFLNDTTIEVKLLKGATTVGRGQLRLKDTKAIQFDPTHVGGDPVQEEFALTDGLESIGVVTMIVHAERNASPPTATPLSVSSSVGQSVDRNEIMFMVNTDRRSSQRQDALQRELFTCDKCNVLRSPGEFSYQYELIDGILHNKAISSTEKEIERIKRKVRDVELDEPIGQGEPCPPVDGDNCIRQFCDVCGGLTITGVTCGGAVEPDPGAEGKPSACEDQISQEWHRSKSAKKSTKGKSLLDPCSRYCERCKTCLNWLPDVCCCPRCGHTPRPTKNVISNGDRRGYGDPPSDAVTDNATTPSSSGSKTVLASSHSCPICHIRQKRCVDCDNRMHHIESSSLSCSSKIQRHEYGGARPVTRRSMLGEHQRRLRELQGLKVFAGAQENRADQLRKVYTGRQAPKVSHPSQEKCRLSAARIRKDYNAFLRKVGRQNRNRYSYRFGKRHPGMVVGHKACMRQEAPVPAHMGWRWNVCTPGIGKRRPGWRPGAVPKPIVQLMQHFLKCYPTDNVPVSGKRPVPFRPATDGEQQPIAGQKPTLRITKQHGEYSITMNPLKDAETLKTTTDAYLPGKPIRFKLSKDPRLTRLYMLREGLKQKGLTLCGCKELEHCTHRNEREKRVLLEEIRRTAKSLGLPLKTTVADLPSDSESELDVEFTPPSAIIRPGARRPDVVVAETQYCEEDFRVRPVKKQGCGATEHAKVPPPRKGPTNHKSSTVVSEHGKGDSTARKPQVNATRPSQADVPESKTTSAKGVAAAKKGDAPLGKSSVVKGAAATKKETPAVPAAVKGTNVRISVAKAKGSTRK